MSAAADAFFEEASPPKDIEWTAPRTQPEVSPQSPRPWFLLLGFVALGVAMRALAAAETVTGPSLLFGLGWAATMAGCAVGTLILARSRDAVTSRHVADAVMLGIATGGFTWLFPHFNGVAVTTLTERIGLTAAGASAGLLVGALIVLALARARTSVATVSFLVACLLVLIGAFLFHDVNDRWIGLALLLGAWTFAIAGWNDRAGGPRRRPPDSATLRSPRSMVSFATAACSAFAIRESFNRGVWADELPAILLLCLMFVAALVSVFDARRQIAGSPARINNWSEWRASVETGVYEGDEAPPVPTEASTPAKARPAERDTRVASMSGPALSVVDQVINDESGVRDSGDSWPPAVTTPTATETVVTGAAPAAGASVGGTTTPDTSQFIPVPANASNVPVASSAAARLPQRTTSELETFAAASAWTADGELLGANSEFWEISQSAPSDGFNFLRIVHPEDRPALALQITRGTRTNLAFRTTVRLVDSGPQTERRVDIAGGPYQPATSPLGMVANASYQVSVDMPQVVAVDKALTTIGLFDPLTGLGNSAYLEQWMARRTTDDRRRTNRPLLVVLELADLGNYEKSEPRLRDVIMTEAAHALHSACRTGDFVVRLDGPYFAAVVEQVVEGEEWYVLSRFEEIVKGTFTIAGRPFKIDGRLLPLRPNPGASLDDILDQVAALLVAEPAGQSTSGEAPAVSKNAADAAQSDNAQRDATGDAARSEAHSDSGTGPNTTSTAGGGTASPDQEADLADEGTPDNNNVAGDGASTTELSRAVDRSSEAAEDEPTDETPAADEAPMKNPERKAASTVVGRPPTIPLSPDSFVLTGHAVPPGASVPKPSDNGNGVGPVDNGDPDTPTTAPESTNATAADKPGT